MKRFFHTPLHCWMCLALTLVMALLLLSREEVHAQSVDDALRFAQRAPATGARMLGMGGAGIAGVTDWSAVFTNPAGLGWYNSSELVGNLNLLSTLDDATFLGQFQDGRANGTRLSNLGYVHKSPTSIGSLVFGVGYNQTNTFDRDLFFQGQNGQNSITDFFMPVPGEFEITENSDGEREVSFFRPISFLAYETFAIDFDEDLFNQGDNVPFLPAVTQGTVEQTGDVLEEGSTNELSFGGAVEAARGVMLGLGANITFGNYNFFRRYEETDLNNDNDGTGGTTDFESLILNEDLESNLIGINLRGGLSAKVMPQLRVGLTVETPTYYTIDERYRTRLSTTFDNGDTFAQDEVADNDYHIISPWRFGGGLAFMESGLTLSVDAEVVDWSQLRLEESGNFNDVFFDDLNLGIRRQLDLVVNTRFGAEYDAGPVAVRAGYALQPDPSKTPELNREKTFVSAGLGFNVGDQLQLNLGWQREQFEDRYQPYTEVLNAPVVLEDITRDRFAVGVSVRF